MAQERVKEAAQKKPVRGLRIGNYPSSITASPSVPIRITDHWRVDGTGAINEKYLQIRDDQARKMSALALDEKIKSVEKRGAITIKNDPHYSENTQLYDFNEVNIRLAQDCWC